MPQPHVANDLSGLKNSIYRPKSAKPYGRVCNSSHKQEIFEVSLVKSKPSNRLTKTQHNTDNKCRNSTDINRKRALSAVTINVDNQKQKNSNHIKPNNCTHLHQPVSSGKPKSEIKPQIKSLQRRGNSVPPSTRVHTSLIRSTTTSSWPPTQQRGYPKLEKDRQLMLENQRLLRKLVEISNRKTQFGVVRPLSYRTLK